MSTATQAKETGKAQTAKVDPLTLARAARKEQANNAIDLTDRERFALHLVLQAGRACKILAKQIRVGQMPDADAIRAAGTLSAISASSFSE